MSRVTFTMAAAAIALSGCMHAIRLELDVPETSAARVSARLTKGTKAPAPDSCQLPCGVAIEPSTSSEITVTAPGYYPAVMSVAYDQMVTASTNNVAKLVVPLVKRPERSAPAGDAPADVPGEAHTATPAETGSRSVTIP